METVISIKSRLDDLAARREPLVSVYLGHEGLQPPKGGILMTQFNSLIHSQLTKAERSDRQSELRKIEEYLGRHGGGTARSYAIFADLPAVWEVFEFEFFLPPLITVGRADVEPILHALESHSKYLVLLADREKALVFNIELGVITERSELTGGDVPQMVKAIRHDGIVGKDDKIARHIEDHLHRHLQIIAETVGKLTRTKEINFVIIGGHKELLRKLKHHLPPDLQRKIVAEIVTALDISPAEVLHKTKPIAAEVHRWPVNKLPSV